MATQRQTVSAVHLAHAGRAVPAAPRLRSVPQQRHLWASVLPGLAEVTLDELKGVGFSGHQSQGGIAFDAGAGHWRSLAARLRTPEQLLARLGEVKLQKPADLEELCRQLRDGGWLQPNQRPKFVVHAKAHTVAKAAWLAHLVDKPAVGDADSARCVVHLAVALDKVGVAVDLAGFALGDRGYRLEPGEAPLHPPLAAALLQWAGLRAGMTLWDPVCGSGTLAIEAALALQPYLGRTWACLDSPALPPQLPAAAPGLACRVVAGDLDPDAVARTLRNAVRAGVAERLTAEPREMAAWPPDPSIDLVISNLPWGVRLGRRADARRLAERWAASVRRTAPGRRAAVVVAEPQVAASLGLAECELLKTRNGGRAVWLVRGRIAGQQPQA